jgi:hypothetical protein
MNRNLNYNPMAMAILFGGILLLNACTSPAEDLAENPAPAFRPVRLSYENATGERAVTRYFYDRMGLNYKAHWQLEDSSRSSVNYYEHDTLGNQIRKYREFSDSLTSDQHFFFDDAGRLTGEDFFRSDGVEGRADYDYDSQGRCIRARCRGLNGWFHGELHFRYDPGGIKRAAGIYREGDSIGFIEYQYDDYGNLTREHWDFNGQWWQSFAYEYQMEAGRTYTSSSVFISESKWFRVKEEYYTYNDETGGPSYYLYDGDGKLAEKEFVRSDGLSTRTTYQYDSTGLLRSSLREYYDGITAEFHYWYNIDRKLLVRTFERSDGGSGSETYRYDDSGLLEKGEWINFDNWLNGTLSFEYGEKGLIQSGKFAGGDGFDANLRFVYDLNQNLVSISWKFSFGAFQKYEFLYEPL